MHLCRKTDKIMEKVYKNCQSCGMPLKKDAAGGGSNADGSKSTMYCSHCFQNGKFTRENVSVEEMQELVKGKMKQMGIPGFLVGVLTKRIPKLERWKK